MTAKAPLPDRGHPDRSYLDHAASTPMLPEAVAAVTAELTRTGNPSSAHGSGRAARRVVEESRELVAGCVGADPAEVVFTSGGTEADNLAVKGAFWAARGADPRRRGVVTTTAEHHAVLDSVDWLAEAAGAEPTLVGVDAEGRLRPAELDAAVTTATAVVSVIWANNEVGTVQPVADVAALAAARGALSHSDAVQAVGHLPVDFSACGLDTLTFTAHKLGGPVGVGALLARRDARLTSLLHGGGQERDLRSGTVPVAAVAGFAAAVAVSVAGLAAEEVRVRALRERLVSGVLAAVPGAVLHGTRSGGLPGVANLAFPGCEADALLMLLDAAGIDCSAGSACAAGVPRPSHVLTAMGLSDAEARSSVRFSLGHTSTATEVDHLLRVLPEAAVRARAAGVLAG